MDKKTTTDKLDPFMCPFNKIHLHSYLTTLLKSKGEQLPHAKQGLHSRVSTTIPTRDTQAGEGQAGVKAAHTRTQQFYWFMTLKLQDLAAAPAAGQGASHS